MNKHIHYYVRRVYLSAVVRFGDVCAYQVFHFELDAGKSPISGYQERVCMFFLN